MTEPAQIILRVPKAVKAAWVLRSRAAGMRLTDWVVEMTELGEKVAQVEFAKEVEDRIFSCVNVEYDEKSGKWAAGLMGPGFGGNGKPYPPGQTIYLEAPYQLLSYEEKASAEYWAGAPWFNSYESAATQMIRWIKENRRDIVRACEDETRQAIAYRRAQALKSKAD